MARPLQTVHLTKLAQNYNNYDKEIKIIGTRHGEKLYETNDLLKGWDGRANGVECQDGVYMYTLKLYSLDEKKYEYSGSISLLR